MNLLSLQFESKLRFCIISEKGFKGGISCYAHQSIAFQNKKARTTQVVAAVIDWNLAIDCFGSIKRSLTFYTEES